MTPSDDDNLLGDIRRDREAMAARGMYSTEKQINAYKRWRGSVTLRERIDRINARPGCEIGGPDVERLYQYLVGYHAALNDAGVNDGCFDGFQDFVQQQFDVRGAANGKSWATLSSERCGSGAAGFAEFKRLWPLFVASRDRCRTTSNG
jgi:hypothetical protein